MIAPIFPARRGPGAGPGPNVPCHSRWPRGPGSAAAAGRPSCKLTAHTCEQEVYNLANLRGR
eukprot:108588-Hanusia_phi.AAC.1